jgi:hypothetical protein
MCAFFAMNNVSGRTLEHLIGLTHDGIILFTGPVLLGVGDGLQQSQRAAVAYKDRQWRRVKTKVE